MRRQSLSAVAVVVSYLSVAPAAWAASAWTLVIEGNVPRGPAGAPPSPLAALDSCVSIVGTNCGTATLLGTICGDMGSSVIALPQCGLGWFQFVLSECGQNNINMSARLSLSMPLGGTDYDLYVYEPCGTLVGVSNGMSNVEQVYLEIVDNWGTNDSKYFYIKIDSPAALGVGNPGTGPTATRIPVEISPNPTNPGSLIRYTLTAPSWVRVSILDSRGGLVRSFDGGILPGGVHELRWDGRDARGGEAAAGIYFARVETQGARGVRKITLLH